MAWTTREMVILGVLVLCMPAQYWLVAKIGTERPQQALLKLGRQLDKLRWLLFESLDWWKRCFLQAVASIRQSILGSVSVEEECPAKEVLHYRQVTGYFGLSPEERPRRPEYISYRVGQVVKILSADRQGALGVIIGWDLYARAPESYLQAKYGDDQELRKEPHYLVMLTRPLMHEIYVAQSHLRVVRATQINHPRIGNIFSHFDGAQYIPRAPLRRLYPLD